MLTGGPAAAYTRVSKLSHRPDSLIFPLLLLLLSLLCFFSFRFVSFILFLRLKIIHIELHCVNCGDGQVSFGDEHERNIVPCWVARALISFTLMLSCCSKSRGGEHLKVWLASQEFIVKFDSTYVRSSKY